MLPPLPLRWLRLRVKSAKSVGVAASAEVAASEVAVIAVASAVDRAALVDRVAPVALGAVRVAPVVHAGKPMTRVKRAVQFGCAARLER